MSKIILSADDFGRSHERNLAIDYAMRNELIYSAALLTNSKYTKEAVNLALKGNYIDRLHCHLNIVSGEISGYSKPIDSEFKKCEAFCVNGEFRQLQKRNRYSLEYWNKVYRELEAQFLNFKKLTDDKANNLYIDFHLYKNMYLPVGLAYRKIIDTYSISSARYFGEHQINSRGVLKRGKLAIAGILNGSRAKKLKSCNIDYFITNYQDYIKEEIMELYVHPDYVDGCLLDNSVSVFGHKKRSLQENINLLKELRLENFEFVPWSYV